MPRDAFVLKIQREICHPKFARKVSGLSRNGPLIWNPLSMFAGRDWIKFMTEACSSTGWALMPMVRTAADAKKLFSASGCIVIRCGLRCRIRWITFHTSFDFLDDNILSMKFLLVDLINSLRRLRAARNFPKFLRCCYLLLLQIVSGLFVSLVLQWLDL